MYIDNERREEIEAKNETRKRRRENREKMEREKEIEKPPYNGPIQLKLCVC